MLSVVFTCLLIWFCLVLFGFVCLVLFVWFCLFVVSWSRSQRLNAQTPWISGAYGGIYLFVCLDLFGFVCLVLFVCCVLE